MLQIQDANGNPHPLDASAAGVTLKGWSPVPMGDLAKYGYQGAFMVEVEAPDSRFYFGPGQPRPLADVKKVRLSELANLRWQKETGGITINSVLIATDDRSQAKLIAARIKAKESNAYTVNWKADGGFISLTAAQIISIADAVAAHVQACFDNEAAHSDEIDDLTTVGAVIAYDITTGWPT